MSIKYTKEYLEKLVRESKSFSEVSYKANGNKRGGACQHVTKKIIEYEIDTSHFDRGVTSSIEACRNRRKFPEEVLILTSNRTGIHRQLKRALIESGVDYTCSECGLCDK